jgi:uncharacterized DUF497 family protein
LNERQFQFEWDKIKAATNLHKHGVSFEVASTIFNDPQLLTVADLETANWKSAGFQSAWQVTARYFLSFTYGRSLIPQQRKFASSQPVKPAVRRFAITRKLHE